MAERNKRLEAANFGMSGTFYQWQALEYTVSETVAVLGLEAIKLEAMNAMERVTKAVTVVAKSGMNWVQYGIVS